MERVEQLYDERAESAIISALVVSPNEIDEVGLSVDDFYDSKCRQLYGIILAMRGENLHIDTVTIFNEIKKRQLDISRPYLLELFESAPPTAGIVEYSNIIRDLSRRRQLLRIAQEITIGVYDRDTDPDTIASNGTVRIAESTNTQTGIHHWTESFNDVFQEIDALSSGKTVALPTGFLRIDNLIGGMRSGHLMIVAARPSMGKTALAVNIAANVAKRGVPVAIFSIEMSVQEITMRLIALLAQVNMYSIMYRAKYLKPEEWARINSVVSLAGTLPIFIDSHNISSIHSIRAKAARLKVKHNISLLIVDYLQLLSASLSRGTRNEEISEISRSLKLLAKDLAIPVMALSQLSRQPDLRDDHRPILSDLRDSGSIEQDADEVIFLYRGVMYGSADDKAVEVHVAKHRNGPVGKVDMQFIKEEMRFDDNIPIVGER